MADRPRPLAGVRVLVTRPAHQAVHFCQLLEAAGAAVSAFPVIEIVPRTDPDRMTDIVAALARAQLAVFISTNAVHHGLQPLLAAGAWPQDLQIAAIGRSTGAALAALGQAPDLVPADGFNTEALLTLPQLQALDGRNVVIFRGEGGREQLADSLRERGADVTYAEVYRRALPKVDPAPLIDLLGGGLLDVITVTSNESLRNLVEMVGTLGRSHLLEMPLVVASGRAAELAGSLGFRRSAAVARDATDEAMFAALAAWHRTHLDNDAE